MSVSTAFKRKEKVFPYGCMCEDGEWDYCEKITQVCPVFHGDRRGYCKTCGHPEECHRLQTELEFLKSENEYLKAALVRNEARQANIKRLTRRF